MTSRRLKSLTLLGGIVASALTLMAWTQPWFTLAVTTTDTAKTTLSIPGSTAAPDLSALSLAGLALVAALAISGPVLRIVFGVLQLAIGGGVVASTLVALGSPVAASSSIITKATGVSGTASVAQLVTSSSTTAWPWLAVVLGVAAALLGVFTVVTARRWPGPARRYEATQDTQSSRSTGPVSDWDELSGGSDPTSR